MLFLFCLNWFCSDEGLRLVLNVGVHTISTSADQNTQKNGFFLPLVFQTKVIVFVLSQGFVRFHTANKCQEVLDKFSSTEIRIESLHGGYTRILTPSSVKRARDFSFVPALDPSLAKHM